MAYQKAMPENKRKVGAQAEKLAEEYLTASGMKIVARNFRNRQGEIDIIGYHEGYLVFVEVKYRASLKNGNPEEAVGASKQKNICKVADYYRYTHKVPLSMPVRYDVVAVLGEEVRWLQNAFPHVYG